MRALLLTLLMLPGVAAAQSQVPSSSVFAELSVRVIPEADRLVDTVGSWLREDKERSVRVAVHADERLGTVDNMYLAAQRAKFLTKALKKAGARKFQVVTDAVGHSGVAHLEATSRIVFTFSGGPPPSI